MNKSTKLTLVLGFLAILFLPLFHLGFKGETLVLTSWLQSSFAIIGSFLGIWIIVKLCFRKIHLSAKEMLLLLGGTFLALLGFAFGRYGLMLIFWLPSVIFAAISYQTMTSFFDRISGLLNKKVKTVEKAIREKKINF